MNLVGDRRINSTPSGWEFLRDLAVMTGAQNNAGIVQRTDSELLFGLVSKSGPDVLVVRQPGGVTTFLPRTQVEDSFEQDWSLMPAAATDLADLMEFITSGR